MGVFQEMSGRRKKKKLHCNIPEYRLKANCKIPHTNGKKSDNSWAQPHGEDSCSADG